MSAVLEPMMRLSTAPDKPVRSARLAAKGIKRAGGQPRTRAIALAVLPPLLGLGLLLLLWELLS
ncbi:MAG: hypothetical protein WKG03_01370, partial [Telluria sp.]